MKVMGLERDNTTLLGTPDPLGWRYSTSFELYPFHEGKDMAVYKGILNGQGPKRGSFCAVKAKLDSTATRQEWRHVQESVRKAHALAHSFNALVQAKAISFLWPMIAEIETVSDFTPLIRLFKPHDKKMKRGEMVLIEDFLDGEFQTLSSTVGWVSPDTHTDLTQAFSHYTWHCTRHLVVCGLQGVSTGLGWSLTTPTLHSTARQFGPNDGGLPAVAEFFSSHRCNNICSSWPGLDVPQAKGQPEVKVHSKVARNQPRRNRNMFCPSPPAATVEVDALPPVTGDQLHRDYIPRVPSAPVFEVTRF